MLLQVHVRGNDPPHVEYSAMDNKNRKCSRCGVVYPATKEFFYGCKPDRLGIERRCKKCSNARADFRKRTRMEVSKDAPCMDCGQKLPACAMSFDHKPEFEKSRELWQLKSVSKEKFQAEIAKCDLVCLNCHAIRTWKRLKGEM